jgi:hypothetical protein
VKTLPTRISVPGVTQNTEAFNTAAAGTKTRTIVHEVAEKYKTPPLLARSADIKSALADPVYASMFECAVTYDGENRFERRAARRLSPSGGCCAVQAGAPNSEFHIETDNPGATHKSCATPNY